MVRACTLREIDPPAFGVPTTEPTLDAGVYRDRLAEFRDRLTSEGFDVGVVYGDREHFANMAYLTGYDPRFEEALLVVDGDETATPLLIVGNEGEGYVPTSPISDDLAVALFQSFSLLGQDRTASESLEELLRRGGVGSGDRVALAGWKHFSGAEFDDPATTHETPAYLVESLRGLAGERNRVRNANALFMDSSDGLRATSGVDQLAAFEFAACHTSTAVRKAVRAVEPGMTEFGVVREMDLPGLPQSCHLMLSTGERAAMGLPSPSSRTVERGDPFTTAYGVRGALNCRAGFVAEGPDDLPEGATDYVERLVEPYFRAVAAWYETAAVGVEGGELYDAVHEHVGEEFFGVELNPGHLIHLDEWVDSPIYADSTEHLRSGMALQMDVIPATGTEYFTTNAEDGVALADADLREKFRSAYPEAWDRIERRRAFMREELGIDVGPDVLPFSNLAAHLPPFLLAPDRAVTFASDDASGR